MEILDEQPSVQGVAEWFTGVVDDVIAAGDRSRGEVDVVHFAPGARTAWHRDARGQTLHVTEGGIGLTRSRGGEVVPLRPGDTVWCPPEEWHRHGEGPATSRPTWPSAFARFKGLTWVNLVAP